MTTKEFDSAVKELKELKTMAAELAQQISMLEDNIKAEMGDDEVRYTSDAVVRYTKTSSVRFDASSFKKEHEDLYNSFCKEASGRRFSIN